MTKLHISYRNAKGHMKSADPFNCPADAPEAVKLAAAALVAAFNPAPVALPATEAQAMATEAADSCIIVGQVSGKGQGRRGRPKGFKCSPETKALMAESKRAMWREVKATLSEVQPDKGWDR